MELFLIQKEPGKNCENRNKRPPKPHVAFTGIPR